VRVGLRLPKALFADARALRAAVGRAEDGGLHQLSVGDHVTFHGGQGDDGLVQCAALAALADRAEIAVSVLQLPLRHPVPLARQVQNVARLAAGGFVLGVGVGGEDRHEVESCGVDPATRGRRTDESLTVLRPLLAGESVSFVGEFFQLEDVAVLPAPTRAVPILVGGRSDAALRRAAVHGDGWLGVWVSAERYAAAIDRVHAEAAAAGRTDVVWRHGLQVWCGFGADAASATKLLASEMERLYALPFERFAKWCPAGPPELVAEQVAAYAEAGASDVNLIAVAETPDEAIDGAIAVRALTGGPS
jgi:alkanesulfonate monooxygenase SsuD/methylene tetrahydromethanopterin reductase-like flavin-dependent oxidoreductase (luciferase family)